MKVLLICVGSRGDAEPFCALADQLLDRGHNVDFFLQPELHSLAPSGKNKNLVLHSLPFGQADFYRFMPKPSHGADHPNPRVRFIGVVTDVIGELVLTCAKQVSEVASSSDLLVTSALARSLCFALSQKLQIPSCLIHLQPLIPTGAFPHYSQVDDCVSAIQNVGANDDADDDSPNNSPEKNRETYKELETFQHDFLEERLDAMYEAMNIEPKLRFSDMWEMLQGNHPLVHIFNSFEELLIPKVTDVGTNVYHVGPLADSYIPQTFSPPDDLIKFLHEEEEEPICVGFGSMPHDLLKVVLDALQSIQKRAVLVGKAFETTTATTTNEGEEQQQQQQQHPWTPQVRFVESAPYAWLLPQCRIMVCHGGAGVVHAVLRAGIPLVIAPLMGDQFSFAKLIEAKGLGVQAGSLLPTLTSQELADALTRAAENKCRCTCQALGERIRARDDDKNESFSLGVKGMAEILESLQSSK